MAIQWLFFDLGNVVFEDDRQNYTAYQQLHQRISRHRSGYSFAEMMNEREQRSSAGQNWITKKLAAENLPADEQAEFFTSLKTELIQSFDVNHRLFQGVRSTLRQLHSQYHLGVIANQPAEATASLARRGLLPLFQVVGISEVIGKQKPDPELFQWAINASGCSAPQAVMIGDRIDNDVLPAQQLGMKGVLIEWEKKTSRVWNAEHENEQLFQDSIERVPLFDAQSSPELADARITSLKQLPEVLLNWNASD